LLALRMPILHKPKYDLSVVIPTTNKSGHEKVLNDFYLSDPDALKISVQFVSLINSKKPYAYSEIKSLGGRHELVTVGNDRYYGSCEENIYRITDFVGILGKFVLIIGDTDTVDWLNLSELVKQELSSISPCEAVCLNLYVKELINSVESVEISVMPVDVGTDEDIRTVAGDFKSGLACKIGTIFPWLISSFGPLDWAAYIGNHVYRREYITKILSYAFAEHVYSLVYKQLLAANSNPDASYRLYNKRVVTRVSKDLLWQNSIISPPKASNSPSAQGQFPKPLPWLAEHRLVNGKCGNFSITHLHYINYLPNELAMLVASSWTLALRPSGNASLLLRRGSFLVLSLHLCANTLRDSVTGRSHLLEGVEEVKYSSFDTRIICDYLNKLLYLFDSRVDKGSVDGETAIEQIRSAKDIVERILTRPNNCDQSELANAIQNLMGAASFMSSQSVFLDKLRQLCLGDALEFAGIPPGEFHFSIRKAGNVQLGLI